MRKVAVDLGDVRIGLASSDIMGIIASGNETYYRKGGDADIDYVAKFARDLQADTIVIGLPVNMDGTEGERAQMSREFGAQLQLKTDCKIVYVDERLTSKSAERLLISADMRREKRKQVIDKVAAAIILQSYLDKIN